jgi:hypothetical protein
MGPLADGIREANVHISLHHWRKGGFRGEESALAALLRNLRLRRLGQVDREEPTGFLTHHLIQDENSYAFIARLLAETGSHPGVRWLSGREVFRI